MKTRNSSVEDFLKSTATHLSFIDKCDCGCGYSKPFSPLERLVQEDMKREGLHYPHISVDDVKAFWNVRL